MNFKIMSILELFSLIQSIITIIASINKIRKDRIRGFINSPYIIVFGLSLLITSILFFVPWEKIHFGEKENKVVHDTIFVNQQIINAPNDTHLALKISPKKVTNIPKVIPQISNTKSPKLKYPDIQMGDNNNLLIGDNNVQTTNLFGKLDRKPRKEDISAIAQLLLNKSKKLTIVYQETDLEAKRYSFELKQKLNEKGFQNVELFGRLYIGPDLQDSDMMLDTINYNIVVELN